MIKYIVLLLLFISNFSVTFSEMAVWPFGNILSIGDSHCPHLFTKYNSWQDFVIRKKTGKGPQEISSHFFNDKKVEVPFVIHYQGPRTMHRAGKDLELLTRHISNNDDIIVFVYGEIDARVHVARQKYLAKREVEEIIQTLAVNYVETVSKIPNSNCIIIAVPPPGKVEFILPENQVDRYFANAPWEKRVFYVAQLNEKLEKECNKRGVLFFNPFEFFTNEDGSLNDNFTKDNHHIAPEFNYIIKDKLVAFIFNHQSYFSKKQGNLIKPIDE